MGGTFDFEIVTPGQVAEMPVEIHPIDFELGERFVRIVVTDAAGSFVVLGLWVPDQHRLGMGIGDQYSWATVTDLESGIAMWLNYPDEWNANAWTPGP